jgi:hydrogenase maturation protease
MKKVLVLGIGNRLMGDDGIGVYVVEALRKQRKDDHITYIAGETDIDYCLHVIEDADVLIIVDAVVSSNKVGEVSLLPLEIFKTKDQGISAHNLHLFHTIPIVYPSIKAYLIGIEIARIDFGLELCEELTGNFQIIVEHVLRNIFACIHRH